MHIEIWSNVLPFFLLQKLVCKVERQEELWGESKGTPLLWEIESSFAFALFFNATKAQPSVL
jgi:hypothetical protein